MLFSFDLHEVVNLVDHATNGRSIFHFNSVTDTTQAQTLNASLVAFPGDRWCSSMSVTLIFFLAMTYPRMSSTVLPRLAATTSGERMSSDH